VEKTVTINRPQILATISLCLSPSQGKPPQVTPVGIYTSWQRLTGQQYPARGTMDLSTGAPKPFKSRSRDVERITDSQKRWVRVETRKDGVVQRRQAWFFILLSFAEIRGTLQPCMWWLIVRNLLARPWVDVGDLWIPYPRFLPCSARWRVCVRSEFREGFIDLALTRKLTNG
jgi:hypothetical protein